MSLVSNTIRVISFIRLVIFPGANDVPCANLLYFDEKLLWLSNPSFRLVMFLDRKSKRYFWLLDELTWILGFVARGFFALWTLEIKRSLVVSLEDYCPICGLSYKDKRHCSPKRLAAIDAAHERDLEREEPKGEYRSLEMRLRRGFRMMRGDEPEED